jgi:hypothetical protein
MQISLLNIPILMTMARKESRQVRVVMHLPPLIPIHRMVLIRNQVHRMMNIMQHGKFQRKRIVGIIKVR